MHFDSWGVAWLNFTGDSMQLDESNIHEFNGLSNFLVEIGNLQCLEN
jgi:hypothetical protein